MIILEDDAGKVARGTRIVLGPNFTLTEDATGVPKLEVSGGGGGVTSVTGTTNRLTAIPTTGAVVIDIASTYVGQTTITTLGTIATGVWSGTAVVWTKVNKAGSVLTDIANVTITAVAAGEILKWSGTAWINNTLAEAGITAVGHTHPTSDIISGTFVSDRLLGVYSGITGLDVQAQALDMGTNRIINIGNTGTDFDSSGGLTLAFDLTISSLGTFDSSVAPIQDNVLRFNGTKWVPAQITFRFTDGDVAAQAFADGTAGAFVDDGRAVDDTPAPVVPSAAPILTAGYKTIVVDMEAHTLPSDKKLVIQWSTDSGTTWSNDGGDVDEIVSTGKKVLHTKLLIDGTTYRYRFRERGATDSAPSPSTADLAPLSEPDITLATIILASQISTVDLASLSANIGVITAGIIKNAVGPDGDAGLRVSSDFTLPLAWDNYIDLTASGGEIFMKAGQGASGVTIAANGTAAFKGQVTATSLVVETTAEIPTLAVNAFRSAISDLDFSILNVKRVMIENNAFSVFTTGTNVLNVFIGDYGIPSTPTTQNDIVWDDVSDSVTCTLTCTSTGTSEARNVLSPTTFDKNVDDTYIVRFDLRNDTSGMASGDWIVTATALIAYRLTGGGAWTELTTRTLVHADVSTDETVSHAATVTVAATSILEFRVRIRQTRIDFNAPEINGSSTCHVTGNTTGGQGIEWVTDSDTTETRRNLRLYSEGGTKAHYRMEPTPTAIPADSLGREGEWIYVAGAINEPFFHDGTNWLSVAPGAPAAHTLDSHSNVAIISGANNDVLVFDGTNWRDLATSGGGGPVGTSRSISSGTGLSGGGDLSANRTLSVDASQTQITALGTIATGVWQATLISTTYTAAKLTSVIGGTGIDVSASTGAVTFTLDVSELGLGGTLLAGDWLVAANASVSNRQLISDIPLGIFNNDQGWTNNTGTVTSVTGGIGIDSTGGAAPSITFDASELPLGNVLATNEHLISVNGGVSSRQLISSIPLGIFNNDQSWAAGTVTAVTGGVGIDSTGGTTPDLSFDASELVLGSVLISSDHLVAANGGVSNRQIIDSIPLGIFNNDQGWTSNAGDITRVNITAGSGLTGSVNTASGDHTQTINVGAGTLIDVVADAVNVDLSELATSTTNGDGDFFVVVDAVSAQKKLTKANIALSGMNNDSGWTSNTGDITAVNITAGNGLSGTVNTPTGPHNQTLALDVDELTAGSVLIGSDHLIAANATVSNKQIINSIPLGIFNNDQGWTSNVGDITAVTVGTGLDVSSSGGPVPNITIDLNELGEGGTLVGTDHLVAVNAAVTNRQHISSIPLSIFNNNAGWTSNTGDITGVNITAGTGLSGSVNTGSGQHTQTLSVNASQTQITAVGALGAGSITSAFGAINIGSSALTCGLITSSNAIRVPSGTVTAPPFTFSSDTKTGIYLQATSQMHLVTNQVARLIIENVGVRALNQLGCEQHDIGNSGTAFTFNCNNGNSQTVDNNGTATVTITNALKGNIYVLKVTTKAGAGSGWNWPTSAPIMRWPGGAKPTMTTTINRRDIITFYFDGTDNEYVGTFALDFS